MKNIFTSTTLDGLLHQLNQLELATGKLGRPGEDDRELWIIRAALKHLPLSEVDGPFHLLHADRPDFLLMANEEVIGIEVTEAISRALARALAKAEQLPQLTDFSLFARDQGKLARLDRASFEEAVQKSQEKRSRGWEGDEPERLVFRLFCEALAGKAKKRSAYEVLRDHHPLFVVVYDRSFAPAVDAERLERMFAENSVSIDEIDRKFLLMADGNTVLELP